MSEPRSRYREMLDRRAPLPPRVDIVVDEDATVDDVVVRDVKMFRLERMGRNEWWGCCYLEDDRDVVFQFRWTKKDGLTVMSERGV